MLHHALAQFSKFGIGILCFLCLEVTLAVVTVSIGLFLILRSP